IRKKTTRFRITCQVPEAKKSWIPLKVLAITRGFFLLRTPQERRSPRSRPKRAPRTRRPSPCRQRSPSQALILGEIGQEVKGARHEDRRVEGPGIREGFGRILDRPDVGEERPRPLRQPPARQPSGGGRESGPPPG